MKDCVRWNLFIIKDVLLLSGKSVFDMVSFIKKVYNIKYVVIEDLVMSGYNQAVGPAQNIPNKFNDSELSLNKLDNFDDKKKHAIAYVYLQENQGRIIKIDDILKLLFDVTQFTWGDFFFFQEYPSNLKNDLDESYPFIISQTDIALRLVDNQFFYIYSANDDLIGYIREQYEIESLEKNSLEKLAYPY